MKANDGADENSDDDDGSDDGSDDDSDSSDEEDEDLVQQRRIDKENENSFGYIDDEG